MVTPLINLLKEIEDSIPVDKWKVGNIRIWPLIRIILSFEVIQSNFVTQSSSNKRPVFSRLHTLIKRVTNICKILIFKIQDRKHRTRNRQADFLLLGRSSARNTQLRGLWMDPVLDSMKYYLSKIGKKTVHLEYDSLYSVRIPRYSDSLFIHNKLELCKLKAYFRALIWRNQDYNLPEFNHFLDILHSNNVSFSIQSQKEAFYQSQVLIYRTNVFRRILKKYGVKVAFCTAFYNPEGLALILACNELKIPSIDIQHGNQGISHPAYSSWKHAKGQKLLPRFFWVWSDYEKKNIQKWVGNEGPLVFIGGNLWVDFWDDPSNLTSVEINKKITSIKKSNNKEAHILLSLQPIKTIEYYLPYIQQSPKNWMWWIRLHPRMIEDLESIQQKLIDEKVSNFCIKDASLLPLPILLRNMDAHLTYNSSVIVESELFDVTSTVLANDGMDLFPEQFKKKIAFHETTIDETIARLRKTVEDSFNKQKSTNKSEESKSIQLFFKILGLDDCQ